MKTPKPTRIGYKGTYAYVYYSRKGYTHDEIKEESQEVSDILERNGKNGGVAISFLYPYGWRSDYFTEVGKPVSAHRHEEEYGEEEEPDRFYAFQIYYNENMFNHVGKCDGKYNDCLYNAIKQAIGDKIPWYHPRRLKKFLGLERKDGIDIKYIPDIDKHLKHHKINVTGDFQYTSPKDSQLVINLKLTKGHYKLDTSDIKKPRHVSAKARIPYFIKYVTTVGVDKFETYKIVYDPELDKERILSHDEYQSINNNCWSSPYILIPTNKTNPENKELKELYQEFVKDAEILHTECPIINLYKTGTNHDTALSLFSKLCTDVKPEPIEQLEAEWINKAAKGGLVFGEPYEGKLYQYDYVSMYPSILNSKTLFPYKEGKFKQLDELEDILIYGIYRCKITNVPEKLFKYNYYNYYTHIDINRARELKAKIELIKDGQANALLYVRSKLLAGTQMFGKFIDMLFPLKKKGLKRAKDIMNLLAGALTEGNTKTMKVGVYKKGEEEGDLKENGIEESIKPLDENHWLIKYHYGNRMFKTDFARIKPFLYAKARKIISSTMEPHIDNIVRCATDGFLCTEKLEIETGNNLGEIAYKGCCDKCKVVNANRVIPKTGDKQEWKI